MATPFRLMLAANADANGNLKIQQAAPPTTFAVLILIATCPGNPNWQISSGGQQLAAGNGPQVNLGPILTMPGELLTITISRATPGGLASGTLSGSQYPTAEEAAGNYVPQANPITLSTFITEQQIDSFTQQPNVVVASRLYMLPGGCQNVRVQVNQNAQLVTFTNFTVVGASTGIVYVPVSSATASTGGFDVWFKPAPPDVIAGVLFSLNTTGSANAVEVVITADLAMNFVVASLTGAGTSSGNPINVNSVTPALWQAPSQRVFNFQAGLGTIALLAGAAGKTVRIFSGLLDIFVAAAGAVVSIQDTTGDNLMQVRADVRNVIPFNLGGEPLANVGAGVQMVVSGGAASATIGFGASQG